MTLLSRNSYLNELFLSHPPTRSFVVLGHQIFSWSILTPFSNVKVVILGQDPYHNDGQAMGLAFSVPRSVPPPPSLVNMYKELKRSIPDFVIPTHGCLESWAKQGIETTMYM